jgi:hypothetical protein
VEAVAAAAVEEGNLNPQEDHQKVHYHSQAKEKVFRV